MPRPYADWSPADDARLLALRAKGVTKAAIGQALGRSGGAVSGRLVELRRCGVDVPAATNGRPRKPSPDPVAVPDRAPAAVAAPCATAASSLPIAAPEQKAEEPARPVAGGAATSPAALVSPHRFRLSNSLKGALGSPARQAASRGIASMSVVTRDVLEPLWASDLTIRDIARQLGVTEQWVSRRAHEFGFPSRSLRPKRVRGPRIKPAPAAKPVPVALTPGLSLPLAIAATEGRYALLAQVAEQHGVSLRAATMLWHKARAGLSFQARDTRSEPGFSSPGHRPDAPEPLSSRLGGT